VQIAQTLDESWSTTTEKKPNPFGEIHVSTAQDQSVEPVSEWKSQSQPYINEDADTSHCTTPRGKSIAGWDWTLAFVSDRANSDNVCMIEKRICTQWILGGLYTNHTCYFNGQGWEYEYLGIRWSDSTTLINQAEQQLGISTISSSVWLQNTSEQYTDDTQWVSNYALIDAGNTPAGRKNNGEYVDNSGIATQSQDSAYDLWPIIARTPEVKISASKEAQINPNGNGTQWIINNRWNSPRLSYSTTNIELESTGPAPVRRRCKTPWGTEVFHNQHVIAFESSSVPQWQSCKSELRTCTQWYLRWSYTQQTCTIAWVRNTNTNDPYHEGRWYYSRGKYYNDDYDYKYYKNGTYNNDWYDDRYYDTHQYSYKSPRKSKGSCLVDGNWYVADGSTFTMYEKSQVWPDDSCRSIIRKCDDGDLSGSDKYRYTRCTQISNGTVRSDPGWYPREDNRYKVPVSDTVYRASNPKSVSPVPRNYRDSCIDYRLGTIEHGDSVKAFKTSHVKAGEKCISEYRTCKNGDLDGSYKYNSCTIWASSAFPSVTRNHSSVYRYTTEDRYNGDYYIRRYDEDRYYNRYDGEYYTSRWSRYDDYDSNVRSYGTKSDPQAWSCSVANYGTLLNSDFLVMYRETKPAPWVACDSVVRTCTNGSLGWASNYNSLRCSTTASVCGNGAKESGEQCDHKDAAKSWRWSGWCSLACIPVQQITVVETKCYDYTTTDKLCNGQNGWTIKDKCDQVRSCPAIDTRPGTVRFAAQEEINWNRNKDSCEPYLSDVMFNVVKCGESASILNHTKITLRTDWSNTSWWNDPVIVSHPWTLASSTLAPWSYQLVARPVQNYSNYTPQSSNPRVWDPNNTYRSSCFDLKAWETKDITAWFKAPMSINDKTHPRRKFDPTNGQKTTYENPKCG
jgi:hypothetical protein